MPIKNTFLYILIKFLIVLFLLTYKSSNATYINNCIIDTTISFKRIHNPTMYIGLAAGKETFISGFFPKLGILQSINIGKREFNPVYEYNSEKNNNYFKYKDMPKYSFYGGADITFFGFFSAVLTFSGYTGFKIGIFTIDNSIAYLTTFPKYQLTYNSKIGIKLGPIWVKSGPSFILKNTYAISDSWMKFNNNYYNFDLNISIPF